MKIQVAEAQGIVLDWMVATCEGKSITLMRNTDGSLFPQPVWADGLHQQNYSTFWAQGGPIVERELMTVMYRHRPGPYPQGQHWNAVILPRNTRGWYGPTPLIAAMRCYVASKLGEEVEVPDELVKG